MTATVTKNSQFSANKSPCLRNGDQGYYDGIIGSRIRGFDWHQGQ